MVSKPAMKKLKETQISHNFFSNGIISSLQVIQHFSHNLLGIASITHCVQEIYSSLPYTYISFSLQKDTQQKVKMISSLFGKHMQLTEEMKLTIIHSQI